MFFILFMAMALTNAEKQRRYRERRDKDPDRKRQQQEYERQAYARKKACGVVKPISELSRRDQKRQRKEWKIKKREQRAQKALLETQEEKVDNSPSHQAAIGKRRREKHRIMQHRKMQLIQQDLKNERRKVDKYKKRWMRLQMKYSSLQNTPRSKTKHLLKDSPNVSSKVRKLLVFHHALTEQIREKYNETSSKRSKQLIARSVSGKVIKRYRFANTLKVSLGMSKKRVYNIDNQHTNAAVYIRKPSVTCAVRLQGSVKKFYLREDNSRMTTGLKQTVTKGKVKKQKQLLNDSMKNLHFKYLAENVTHHMSYQVFCQLKPFWVKHPTATDRDTCQCKTHENPQFMADKLKSLGLLESSKLEDAVTQITCSTSSLACMYRFCTACKEKHVPFTTSTGTEGDNCQVQWKSWRNIKEKRTIALGGGKTEDREVRVTKKVLVNGTIDNLKQLFHSQLQIFSKHMFNIKHQYTVYRHYKQTMGANECLIHIDFAENYVGKSPGEVQSTHYGASQHQITLHTGVYYIGGDENPHAFCSVSDSLHHGPAAIWTHLKPVLDDIQNDHAINIVHFLVMGPLSNIGRREIFTFLLQICQSED